MKYTETPFGYKCDECNNGLTYLSLEQLKIHSDRNHSKVTYQDMADMIEVAYEQASWGHVKLARLMIEDLLGYVEDRA